MTASDWWWPDARPSVSYSYASPFPPPAPAAANDTADLLGVNEPTVILATFPDAILLTVEGDDALDREWRRLFPLAERERAEQAAHDLAGWYGLTVEHFDHTDVLVIRG